jgi:spermidine/putrescine transport system substrate-binding protein
MKRTMLSRLAAIAALAILGSLLASCGDSDQRKLYVYNWADYINEDLLDQFEQETGIKVILDFFDTNESMFAKLRAGAAGYDVAFPSGYMVEIMRKNDMLLDLDHGKLPNIGNIDRFYVQLQQDRDMAYSVPYMVVATGIGYRPSVVGQLDEVSWSIVADPRFRGRTSLLNDARETISAGLKYLGYSSNSTSVEELEAARDVIIEWKRNIAKFEADTYRNSLASGEFVITHLYSGDVVALQDEMDDVDFLIPVEGTTISMEAMVILKDAPNPDEAYEFINFLLRGEVAAANSEYIYYLAPNTAAYGFMSPDIIDNPMVNFDKNLLTNSEVLRDPGEANALYSRIWDEIKAAR